MSVICYLYENTEFFISETDPRIMNPQETEQVIARDELWVPTAERVNISTTNVRLEATKEGKDFTKVQNDEDTLTFLVDLGYSGPLYKYTNMFVDHMHQPWRTLAACINKCLSRKTASNDKLRKSRIDILWGMFYRENVDYPSLIWEDIAYQIDHRREKKSRRQYGPSPFGVATMLNKEIIQSESYKRFILYSTGQIPPKKSRGKGSQGKKSADPTEESVNVSDESEPEPLIRRKTSSRRVTKNKAIISVDDNIVPEPNIALELGKSISLLKLKEDDCSTTRQVLWHSCKKLFRICPEPARRDDQILLFLETTQEAQSLGNGGLDEGTGEIPWGPDDVNFCRRLWTTMKETDLILSIFTLRVAKLEQDMSEVKKFDHSDDVLASIFQYQDTPVVDKYLGNQNLMMLSLKGLLKDTNDRFKEIIRIKREQEEKKQEPKYTIKSTDQVALEEFDLKSALFKFMHKKKSANRNPANYRLYHALMEALIEDENAMDKEVCRTREEEKRESESAQKPSTTKESSKGKDPKAGSKTGKFAPAKDLVKDPTEKVIIDELPTEDIPISNEGHVSDPEDTDNAHMTKIPDTTTWFRPILKEERPASPESEWVIPPIDIPEADNNWANAFAKAHQDPDGKQLTITRLMI
ncbi:hypothetical protein Tco_0151829 [Tanacetum coccineum]